MVLLSMADGVLFVPFAASSIESAKPRPISKRLSKARSLLPSIELLSLSIPSAPSSKSTSPTDTAGRTTLLQNVVSCRTRRQ